MIIYDNDADNNNSYNIRKNVKIINNLIKNTPVSNYDTTLKQHPFTGASHILRIPFVHECSE